MELRQFDRFVCCPTGPLSEPIHADDSAVTPMGLRT